MQVERLKPVVDVPLRVRLDVAAEGEYQSRSQWPDYKYLCNRGQAHLYLVEQGRQALIRSGARAGDDVEILKRLDGKAVSYEIKILTPGVPQAVIARTPPAPIKTNGHAAAPPAAQQIIEETGEQRIGRRVKVCGRIALDAIADWEAYSTKIGVKMQFESDDVRALAITLLIEIMRREGAR
jgi:hypothetical protein